MKKGEGEGGGGGISIFNVNNGNSEHDGMKGPWALVSDNHLLRLSSHGLKLKYQIYKTTTQSNEKDR